MPRRKAMQPAQHGSAIAHRNSSSLHASHGLKPIKLNITKAQLHKAHRGQKIRVLHHNIGVGHTFNVHPTTHEKLVKAHHGKRGTTIHITPHELAGSGIFDTLKDIASKVASPVLSGLAGVAKEIFPDHSGTVDKIREGIRTATGYGIHKPVARKRKTAGRKKNNVHFMPGSGSGLRGPSHFPAQHEQYMHYGSGINPSGFY